MIALIAESKTMNTDLYTRDKAVIAPRTPEMEIVADETMAYLHTIDKSELSHRLGISPSLSTKAQKLILDYPNKELGKEAIFIYTGEVFRALKASTLSEDALNIAKDRLRIISSLYGLLRPDDFIRPYRLEFKKEGGPDGTKLSSFLRPKITVNFVKFLKERGETEVIDLLPKDASDCLDWKIIKAFAKVTKINFKIIEDGNRLKTPDTGTLKKLRGLMLRDILENNINSFEDLCRFTSQHYLFDPVNSKPGLAQFLA